MNSKKKKNKWWPFPICSRVHSSAAVVFGQEVYSDDTSWFIDKCHTMFLGISNAKYWLYYRLWPKHKHHIVYTDLKPGYWCQDHRMLWACMKCLGDYIEEQGGVEELQRWSEELLATPPNENGIQEVNINQANRQLEVLAIYHWWKVEKPANEARREYLCHEIYKDRDMVTFKPITEQGFHEAVFKEFTPGKKVMEAEMHALDEKIDADEQSMLHRLIEIRRGLWT